MAMSQLKLTLLWLIVLSSAQFLMISASQSEGEIIEESDNYYHFEAGSLSDWDGQQQSDQWQQMLTGSRFHQPKCIDIPQDLGLCREIGYTSMRLPNLLDHDSIDEVIEQAKSWVPLLGIRCHPDTQLFLCSLFSPVCLDRAIWPCRSLCQAVQEGCEQRMLKYRFPWPEMVRCDKFPLDNDLCIGPQTDVKPDETICQACQQPETVEGIVDNYCSADFVVRMKVREDVIFNGDLKLTAVDKKRMYKKDNLKKRDYRGEVAFYVENGANCECPRVESGNRRKSYLVMGKKVSSRLVVTFITEFNQQNADLKKALRAIRKQANICDGGVEALAVRDEPRPDKKPKRNRDHEAERGEKEDTEERRGRNSKRDDERDGKDRDEQGRKNRKERGRKDRTKGNKNRNKQRDSTNNARRPSGAGDTLL